MYRVSETTVHAAMKVDLELQWSPQCVGDAKNVGHLSSQNARTRSSWPKRAHVL